MAKGQRKVGQDKDCIIADLPRACSDELAAVEFMERQRWGGNPACVHCGSVDVYMMTSRSTGERNARFLWRCRDCGKQYTVRVGTIMEDSPIPLRHWCFAFWKACTCKNGVAALEIRRQTGLSYKSALFMMHRIRHAMAGHVSVELMQGTVEADETYVGGKPANNVGRYGKGFKPGPRKSRLEKVPVMVLIQRGGEARASVLRRVTTKSLRRAIRQNVCTSAALSTDQAQTYKRIGKEQAGGHLRVNHQYRYVDGDAHTNTAESFFSSLKRAINGSHIHVSKRHLHRYVSEAEFRWNHRKLTDGERVVAAIRGGEGKRLMYRDPLANVDSLWKKG